MSVKTKEIKICNYCGKELDEHDFITVNDVPYEGYSELYYVGINHKKESYDFTSDLDFCNLDCFIDDVKKKMEIL